eukprot:COSAG02_NODE_39926_length_411_cov_0.737179_1_plen_55_part_10
MAAPADVSTAAADRRRPRRSWEWGVQKIMLEWMHENRGLPIVRSIRFIHDPEFRI